MKIAQDYFTEARKQHALAILAEVQYEAAVGISNVDHYRVGDLNLLTVVDQLVKATAAIEIVRKLPTARDVAKAA